MLVTHTLVSETYSKESSAPALTAAVRMIAAAWVAILEALEPLWDARHAAQPDHRFAVHVQREPEPKGSRWKQAQLVSERALLLQGNLKKLHFERFPH